MSALQNTVEEIEFIYYTEDMQMRGGPEWPPSIFSYYGHPIPVPNVRIYYTGRGRKHLDCVVVFKKQKLNSEIGLLVEVGHYAVPAWQGDNNLIHLLNVLPGETEKDLNMSAFYESSDELDIDYLQRLRKFYNEEELIEKVPEVSLNIKNNYSRRVNE